MSSNDIIIFDTNKIEVIHKDVEDEDNYYSKKKFKNLKEAIKYIKKIQDGVEYRVQII